MSPDTKIILEVMDRKFAEVDSRFDGLEKKIEDEVEALAIMTSNGFDRLEARIEKLEKVRV